LNLISNNKLIQLLIPKVANFKIKHVAEDEAGGRKKWRVFIDGQSNDLDTIESVEYKLPKDFPRDQVTGRDREDKFSLDASGSGSPVIYAEIKVKGKPPVTESHTLTESSDTNGTDVEV
jgi:hypothetical protein